MSYDNDQTDSPLPAGDNSNRKSVDLLPKYFRTQANKKILSSTIDQLVQPGTAEKVSGYMGRKNAKAFRAGDTYIADVTEQRENRQLEPATVSVDDLGNVKISHESTGLEDKIALLLLDMDLYGPTLGALKWCRPRLQVGTIIMLDEFFAFAGRKDRGECLALTHFLEEYPEVELRHFNFYGSGGSVYIVSSLTS